MFKEEIVVEKLKKLNWHISFAESCTGGMVSATLVNVADASKVFDESFVTYANKAKTELIGVDESVIMKFGVVSEEVAAQMAEGAAKTARAEVGVGISGIAGPSGATATKPVGLVCFGFCVDGSISTFSEYFGDIGRNNVRKRATEFVFEKLSDLLEDVEV